MLDLLTGPSDSLLVARLTIRELAANAEAEQHEQTIHTARIHAAMEALLGGDSSLGDSDVRRWLCNLVAEPDKYGVDVADHIALVSSGYLLLDAPLS